MDQANHGEIFQVRALLSQASLKLKKLIDGPSSIMATKPSDGHQKRQDVRQEFTKELTQIGAYISNINIDVNNLWYCMAQLDAAHQVRWVIAQIQGKTWNGDTLGKEDFTNYYSCLSLAKDSYKRRCKHERDNRKSKKKVHSYIYAIIQINEDGSWEILKRSDLEDQDDESSEIKI